MEFEKYFEDLNKDGVKDCVLLIKKTDSTSIVTNHFDKKVDRKRRGIVVLFKNTRGYQLADKNYHCFSSENKDGGIYFPPYLWIEIKNEKLYVHYGHGRYGYWEYTFSFQNSNFKLLGYDQSDNRGSFVKQQISINFLTKKKLEGKNTYQLKKEEVVKDVFIEKWSDIAIESVLRLSEIKDFDELDMYNY